jgi:hypothetical protein
MSSLRKTGYLAFALLAGLLIFVILLGFRQYQITAQYNRIISQSEESIFQFSTIRERITSGLIEQNWDTVIAATKDLTPLNASITQLLENDLIPAEYKLDLAGKVDLSGLALSAQKIVATADRAAYSLNLQQQTRLLGDYLLRFDRIIVSQMRAKVVRFQTIMIGALGSIICIISFMLIILYQKTVLPLLRATRQNQDDSLALHNAQMAGVINEGTNLSNGIINYAQLLFDSCQGHGDNQEEKEILLKIMSNGERIAHILKKCQSL